MAALCAGRGVPFADVFTALETDPVWCREVAAGDG
jgi:hypothetical protein